MQSAGCKPLLAMGLMTSLVFLLGCAEGPLASYGGLSPWVRQQWAEEERIVRTFYGRREQLRDLAYRARSMDPGAQQQESQQLATLLRDEPVTLMRIEIIQTLAAFPTPSAAAALRAALSDEDPDVRIAACQAWERRGGPDAVAALQHVLGSDTDIDVRLAATRSLGAFRGEGAVNALSIALDDADPAMQFRAMESLRLASGRNLGGDVVAWREYVRSGTTPQNEERPIVKLFRDLF